MFRFMDTEQQECHRHQPRHHGHPEYGSEIIGPEQHQPDREQGAEECPNGIERLPQTEGGAPELRRSDIRDQSVPWCAAHTFPHSVQQAGGQNEVNAGGDDKERLGECA